MGEKFGDHTKGSYGVIALSPRSDHLTIPSPPTNYGRSTTNQRRKNNDKPTPKNAGKQGKGEKIGEHHRGTAP
jgi:hypothetical protein